MPYSTDELLSDLTRLTPRSRAVFAALCAERLLPLYRRFSERAGHGDAMALERVLEALWSHLGGGAAANLAGMRDLAESLIPPEDDTVVSDSEFADDAAAAAAYAINCAQTGDAQDAAWSASRIRDSIDHFLGEPGIVLDARAQLERIESHPLFRAEFRRQRRDAGELYLMTDEMLLAALPELRSRATAEGQELMSGLTRR